MSTKFTKEAGFTIEDMLHFGFDHVDTGLALLRSENPSCYDSAGYVINLGFELILKAWHLYEFGFFKDTHPLNNLTDKLKSHKCGFKLSRGEEETLKMVDSFYQLRYPRREDGPIEIGSDEVESIELLLDAIWQQFPDSLEAAYKSLTPTSKGGRVLMKKKIEVADT